MMRLYKTITDGMTSSPDFPFIPFAKCKKLQAPTLEKCNPDETAPEHTNSAFGRSVWRVIGHLCTISCVWNEIQCWITLQTHNP